MIPHSASHLDEADFDFVRGVLERNFVGRGPLCTELERELSARYGRCYATLTHSGTAALQVALLALKERYPGKSRVLASAYLCPEVISAIQQAGLEPVLIDVCVDSLNLDLTAAAARVDAATLALICSHVGGRPDDLEAAVSLGIPVISDCAQGVGSQFATRDVTSWGTCSILSFGATKMITAGAGGALLTDDAVLGARIADLTRSELTVEEYRREGFRVTLGQHVGELTAGLALSLMRRLDASIARRREIAGAYDRVLSRHVDVRRPAEGVLASWNRFRYYFLTDFAGIWLKFLRSRGIDARSSISHSLPEYFRIHAGFPRLAVATQRIVSVPVHPALTIDDVARVSEALFSGPQPS